VVPRQDQVTTKPSAISENASRITSVGRADLQLASVTGPWGMSFVVLLFPATLALFWYLRQRARRQATLIGALLAWSLLRPYRDL
jgi:apolipoprotein N-acyltransferase